MLKINSIQLQPNRFWEIDSLRGVAVIAMIFYHLMWDLSYFGAYSGNMLSPQWQGVAQSIGTTFIFVMGLSLTLSYNQVKANLNPFKLWQKYFWRGLRIMGWGLLVSFGTYLLVKDAFVIFGILHLLGASIILAYPFLHSKWLSLIGGVLIISAGFYIKQFISYSPWLIWLGVRQIDRHMVDYYPVLPWFGVALLGVFVGYTLYPQKKPRFALPDLSQLAPIKGLRFLGQHSLPIYLIHQPILFGILIILGIGHL